MRVPFLTFDLITGIDGTNTCRVYILELGRRVLPQFQQVISTISSNIDTVLLAVMKASRFTW